LVLLIAATRLVPYWLTAPFTNFFSQPASRNICPANISVTRYFGISQRFHIPLKNCQEATNYIWAFLRGFPVHASSAQWLSNSR
jgi:hypothetical protein